MFSIMLSLSLFTVCQTATDAEVITFKSRNVAVGDMMEETVDFNMNMEMKMSMGGQEMPAMKTTEKSKRKIVRKVLAVEGDKTTRIQFTLAEFSSEKEQPMMGTEKEESVAAGNTYIVESKDGSFVVTNADGEAASTAESDAVIEEVGDDLFDPRRQFGQLIDGPVTVGKPVKVAEDVTRFLLNDESAEMGIEESTLTLTGTRDVNGAKCGVFEFVSSVKNEIAEGPMNFTIAMEVKGEIVVEIDTGWISSIDTKGPMSLKPGEGGPQGLSMEGSGTYHMQVGAAFGK